MRLTRALDRHLGFDRRMELVLLEPRDRIEQWPWLLAGAGAEDDLAVPTDDVVEVARVPRGHDMAAAGGTLLELGDDVRQLVDVRSIRRDPIAPLLSVVAAGVPGKPRLRDPVRRERVAIPDAYAERVQLVHVG